jgi:hypothetical protein
MASEKDYENVFAENGQPASEFDPFLHGFGELPFQNSKVLHVLCCII